MAKILQLVVFGAFLILSLGPISCIAQQPCASYTFPNGGNRFSSCSDLSALNFSLHWNYDQSSNKVDMAIRHMGIDNVRRWIAWAINPTSTGMIGSQAIIAFPRTDGSVAAYPSPVSSYGTRLEPGNLTFPISHISATFENGVMIVFATLRLLTNCTTTVNHVWQEGPLSGDTPMIHSLVGSNLKSFGSLDFLSGRIISAKGGSSSTTIFKYVHGTINAVSWGILMPMGAIIARYLKVFKSADPLWFYLHMGCQVLAVSLGVIGFVTGLILGHRSTGIQYTIHRNIGFAVIFMAAAQVFVAFCRPHKDSKKRPFFNWFHYLVGYSTIIMGICNIFKGFHMLQEASTWKLVYIGIIATFGFAAAILEGYTLYLVLASRKNDGTAEKGNNPTEEA